MERKQTPPQRVYERNTVFFLKNERERREFSSVPETTLRAFISLFETALRRVFDGNAAAHANDSLFERRRKNAISFLRPPCLLQRKSSERTLYRKNVVVSE